MLRGDNIICGVTSTGTGALALAAPPTSLGGVDPFVAFGGIGFGTTNGVPISYTLIEFTDSTFAQPKQSEKGWGRLTFGASLDACTVSRDTVQITTTPDTAYSAAGPAAISIGTAANTLLLLAPSAADSFPCLPWFGGSSGAAQPLCANTGGGGYAGYSNGYPYFIPFVWVTPMVVKRAAVAVQAGAATTGDSNLALYAFAPDGTLGKLLVDFGPLNSANPFGASGMIATAALAQPFFMAPGEYVLRLIGTCDVSSYQLWNGPTLVTPIRMGVDLSGGAYPKYIGMGGGGQPMTPPDPGGPLPGSRVGNNPWFGFLAT